MGWSSMSVSSRLNLVKRNRAKYIDHDVAHNRQARLKITPVFGIEFGGNE